MPDRERSIVGAITDSGHYPHPDHCVFNNLANMLLYASSGIRAPGTNGTVQEEAP